MNNLSKSDFIHLMATEHKISKLDASKAIHYFTSSVESVLSNGDKLTLVGFGNFYILANKARDGRNPKTGEAMKVSASNTPKFKAGSLLKKACNKK